MKRLILLGYAPAEKVAWPCGQLREQLEPLDPRHGVFPNLVMAPLLSALCFTPPEQRSDLFDLMRETILEERRGGHVPLRLNVLTNDLTEKRPKKNPGERRRRRRKDEVVRKRTRLSSEVRAMIRFAPPEQEARAAFRIRRGEDLCLVFSYWSVSAMLSSVISGEPEQGWSAADLHTFSNRFLRRLLDANRRDLGDLLGLPASIPNAVIPKLGIYSRVFARTADPRVRAILIDAVAAECVAVRGSAPPRDESEWIIGVLESLLPLPHNEMYQSYKETTNPIGKYHASFLRGVDPSRLQGDDPPELLWKYVGRSIADKLEEPRWPLAGLGDED